MTMYVCLSVCLSVYLSVCPANILVFYFSAIRRDVTFETIYRSGGLIDSCSVGGVFTECHCGRLGDHALLGAKYWAPSDDRVG